MTSQDYSVHHAYNTIAKDFSATRQAGWDEFYEFEKYIKKGGKVLDIGCGNGRLLNFLERFDVDYIGVDLSENLLKEAKDLHPEAQFFCDNMAELKTVEGQKFDCIFFIASFHHLPTKEDRQKCLARVKELLTDDGVACFINWNLFQEKYRKHVWQSFLKSFTSKYTWNDTLIPFTRSAETTQRYYHAFTPWELDSLFKNAGFSVLDSFSYNKERVKYWWQGRNLCSVIQKSS